MDYIWQFPNAGDTPKVAWSMSVMYLIQGLQGRLWGYGAVEGIPWHGEGQGFESP